MEKLMNLKGAKLLSKAEQKSITGGWVPCNSNGTCPKPYCLGYDHGRCGCFTKGDIRCAV